MQVQKFRCFYLGLMMENLKISPPFFSCYLPAIDERRNVYLQFHFFLILFWPHLSFFFFNPFFSKLISFFFIIIIINLIFLLLFCIIIKFKIIINLPHFVYFILGLHTLSLQQSLQPETNIPNNKQLGYESNVVGLN